MSTQSVTAQVAKSNGAGPTPAATTVAHVNGRDWTRITNNLELLNYFNTFSDKLEDEQGVALLIRQLAPETEDSEVKRRYQDGENSLFAALAHSLNKGALDVSHHVTSFLPDDKRSHVGLLRIKKVQVLPSKEQPFVLAPEYLSWMYKTASYGLPRLEDLLTRKSKMQSVFRDVLLGLDTERSLLQKIECDSQVLCLQEGEVEAIKNKLQADFQAGHTEWQQQIQVCPLKFPTN